MSTEDLEHTALALMDHIAEDPENWRQHEDSLRQVAEGYDRAAMTLPAALRVYIGWLEEDDFEDQVANLPV